MYPDLERLFSELSKIVPLGTQLSCQPPGNEKSVFQLEKSGECYFLIPCPLFKNSGSVFLPLLDGLFLYAILVSYPQQVMVGSSYINQQYSDWQEIAGHTSITLGSDALYAGQLFFISGKLVKWNNASGHYRPSGDERHTQLTPNVKRLLPEHLFRDIYEEIGLKQ